MKAWVLYKPGDIRFEEAERPQPSEGEVLVKVEAAGICGSDIPRTFDTGAHKMPLIIGHEFSGSVVVQSDSEKENIDLNVDPNVNKIEKNYKNQACNILDGFHAI